MGELSAAEEGVLGAEGTIRRGGHALCFFMLSAGSDRKLIVGRRRAMGQSQCVPAFQDGSSSCSNITLKKADQKGVHRALISGDGLRLHRFLNFIIIIFSFSIPFIYYSLLVHSFYFTYTMVLRTLHSPTDSGGVCRTPAKSPPNFAGVQQSPLDSMDSTDSGGLIFWTVNGP
jgi:hypothetical protein